MDYILIDGLVDVLKNEEKIYLDILKAAREKTKIIIDNKINELENATKLEQTRILQIADLEDIREKITVKLAAQFNKKPEELNITSIKSMLPENKAQILDEAHKRLLKILNELKEVNTLNSRLIRNSLEYIDFSVNLLTGAEVSGNLYGNSGQSGEVKKRNFFDVKL